MATGRLSSPSHVCTLFSVLYVTVLIRGISVCFVAIIPMEKMFDWGGEQMALYLGKDLGDLLIITMNK